MTSGQCRREPLFDVDEVTGRSQVFFADRSLETFGWCGRPLVLVASSAGFRAR
jgi:hypothetical protein